MSAGLTTLGWAPFDLVKGADGLVSPGLINGIASSERCDADDEVIVQAGLDWAPFLANGYITFEHPANTLNIIGEPVELTKGLKSESGAAATGLRAQLYVDQPEHLATRVWKVAETLHKGSSRRRLGFSIEGNALERDPSDPKRVTKGVVRSVVVTHAPKNPDASFDPIFQSVMAAIYGGPATAPFRPDGIAPVTGLDKIASDPAAQMIAARMAEALSQLSLRDLFVSIILRDFPHLTWSQGVDAYDQMQAGNRAQIFNPKRQPVAP